MSGSTRIVLLALGLFGWLMLAGQSGAEAPADTTAKRIPFHFRGSLSLGGELYGIDGRENRRSPWSYYAQGRLQLGVGKFSMPVSFAYRDRQFSYDYTFNRIGLSPTLGIATLHLGWRNMSFSPYTFSGRTFYGIGTEIKPGNFYVGALYGEIQNPLAIRDSLVTGASLIPIFDRKLYGAKVGFRSGANHLELMAMKIWDDESSFDYPADYDLQGYNVLTPKENVVLGVNTGFGIGQVFDFAVKTGFSGFTNDLTDPLTGVINGSVPDQIEELYTVNTSSRLSFAGDASLNLRIKATRLGVQYRRVEPFYTTLATNFFANDLEQYTFNLTTAAFKRKLRLNGRLGIERNNLREYRSNDTERIIGRLQLAYKPTPDWNFGLNYSNYQTSAETRILSLNDTLRFVSVSNQAGFTASWLRRGQSRDLNLSLYTNYQNIDDQSAVERLTDLTAYSAALSAAWRFKHSELSIGPNIHYNRYLASNRTQERWGLGLTVAKPLIGDRLLGQFSSSISQNDLDGLRDGLTGIHSLRFRLRVGAKGQISWYNSYRHVDSVIRQAFNEWRSSLRYGLRF